MNKDQLGYYVCGNLKTYSKIEALEHAHLINTPVQWIFNDDVFSTHPWHIDTQQDIKKLYKKRAQQLREKYDYIVIWYSGGADSFTVVNSFRENNIHVDEIAQFHSYEGEKTWNSYLNKEVKDVAIPQTLEFLKSMPHTKHRTVDLTAITKSIFDEDNNHLNFIYYGNHAFGPHHLARSYLREKVADWAKIIASGKKLCFVYGCDKPPVHYDTQTDKYFLQFQDLIDACVGPRTQILGRQEEHDELFYWSPDAMDLMARQAHIIMNYMRNPPKQDLNSRYLTTNPWMSQLGPDNKYLSSGYIRKRAGTNINNQFYYLTTDGLHRLIYPDWREDTFSLGKNLGFIFGPRDRWWWQAHRDKNRIMFRTAFESYYKKFTKWGFNSFKFTRQLLNDPKLENISSIELLKKIPVNQLLPKENINNINKTFQLYLVNKFKSKLSYAADFRNVNIDTSFSKKYYLEKLTGN
jgi:hypothetical protein